MTNEELEAMLEEVEHCCGLDTDAGRREQTNLVRKIPKLIAMVRVLVGENGTWLRCPPSMECKGKDIKENCVPCWIAWASRVTE